jgi:hypothetical protein
VRAAGSLVAVSRTFAFVTTGVNVTVTFVARRRRRPCLPRLVLHDYGTVAVVASSSQCSAGCSSVAVPHEVRRVRVAHVPVLHAVAGAAAVAAQKRRTACAAIHTTAQRLARHDRGFGPTAGAHGAAISNGYMFARGARAQVDAHVAAQRIEGALQAALPRFPLFRVAISRV